MLLWLLGRGECDSVRAWCPLLGPVQRLESQPFMQIQISSWLEPFWKKKQSEGPKFRVPQTAWGGYNCHSSGLTNTGIKQAYHTMKKYFKIANTYLIHNFKIRMWYPVDSVTLWRLKDRKSTFYKAPELAVAVERSEMSNLHQLRKAKKCCSAILPSEWTSHVQ